MWLYTIKISQTVLISLDSLFFIFVKMNNTLPRYAGIITFLIMGIFNSYNSSGQETPCNRKAVAAGRFYSDNPEELKNDLKACFENTNKVPLEGLQAVIVPHAGYVFSGQIAAKAFASIDTQKQYKRIFLIASSHYAAGTGASIYNKGNYETPLGVVNTDKETIEALLKHKDLFSYLENAHNREHSLEVQLPFLQYLYDEDLPPVVPIVITTQNANTCHKLADILKPYFTQDNLFIISSDFSHYPAYADANRVDRETAKSILSKSPEQFLKTLQKHDSEGVENLATSACGWTSILTLMFMAEEVPGLQFNAFAYKNSGDHPAYGDKSGVVGYHAITLSAQSKKDFKLTKTEENQLLEYARYVIEKDLLLTDKRVFKFKSEALNTKCGAFVTLHKGDKLRGCIGRFGDQLPLWKVVEEMAFSAAFQDTRFSPVTAEEMKEIHLEISILTPLTKVDDIDEIIPGKHGVYLKNGFSSGTFLPQVATETGWNREQLLGHLSRDKAGLDWDGWRNSELYIYEAIILEEQ